MLMEDSMLLWRVARAREFLVALKRYAESNQMLRYSTVRVCKLKED